MVATVFLRPEEIRLTGKPFKTIWGRDRSANFAQTYRPLGYSEKSHNAYRHI
jgi:hypothetical protein